MVVVMGFRDAQIGENRAPGAMVFHVLNRDVGGMRLLEG